VTAAPARTTRSARAAEVVARARALLEAEGPDALTMRRLAGELGIRAPSLYKHLPDKAALEAALVEEAMVEMGTALHRAVGAGGGDGAVHRLLQAYRGLGVARPHLYRLATARRLANGALPPGLEDWAGAPFFLAAGDPHRAQALWSLAHGMVILEIDGRYPPGSDLDRTWRAAAEAFATMTITPVRGTAPS
jgi:AcrR family transcriptional regulator